MDGLSLWIFSPDDAECSYVEALVARLEAGEITCRRREAAEGPPRGPGLLVGGGALELLAKVRSASSACDGQLLVVTVPEVTIEAADAWQLLNAGAADVLPWRDEDELAGTIAARLERWHEVDRLLGSPAVQRNLIGRCTSWRQALARLVEIARFTSASVLVNGESGTGKELAARLVHTLDAREGKGELILVDCTTLSPQLSGSEFFGHDRGAFTQAHQSRDGAFALADRGTLFLDEVGELPPRLQAELLRVIQEGTFKRLGSNRWQKTRFRLVCATHRDLRADVEAGRFRADLYWRLATWTCRLPALRHRLDDVPRLVDHFLEQELGVAPEVDPAVRDVLLRRTYPGNVRDLKQLVQRMAQRHVGDGPITVGDLPPEERLCPGGSDGRACLEGAAGPWNARPLERLIRQAMSQGASLEEIKSHAADAAVRLAVAEEDDQQRAAERLRISRRAVQLRLAAMRERDG